MYVNRVAVLRGGPSSEYDISLITGAGVIDALRARNFFVKDVMITKGGEWLINGLVRQPQDILMDIDAVFIALHGSYGEDGTVQRQLDRLKIPYTGSGAFSSNIAMNKFLAKEHLKEKGIKMPKHMKLSRDGVSDLLQTVYGITQLFGPKYFVKPVNGGSSIDTISVDNPGSLASAISKVFENNPVVLVEEKISGREATVGILENFRNEKLYVLPTIEIVPPAKSSFFSADVKYTGETEEICPGRFSKAEKEELSEAAVTAHKALNLSQYSRSDFIVANDGVYFLEINTLPGLTSESLFPKALNAVGSSYEELVEHLANTASL